MAANRQLNWDGCNNVRDLGGMKTRDGRTTRWGAVVRGDHPARLSAAGWLALQAHGVRTIISLRTVGLEKEDEQTDAAPRPEEITTLQAAIEDVTDAAFVQQWVNSNLWGTPLYFRDALERWPERHAAVVAAVAQARPGGVLFHCIRGYDRTGIVAVLLLALAGVVPNEIVADYELSVDSYRDELLAQRNTSTREVLLATLEWLDADAYLRAGGLSQADLEAVRMRMLD
ncbi:MAG: tyrosine-protein phosphatase [Chloroflexota bacterium]